MLKKAGWTDRYSYDASIEILRSQALKHAELSGPFAPILRDFLRRGDWDSLLGYKLTYAAGDNPLHLVHARQSLAFFQKLEPLKLPGVDKELTAFRKFAKTEETCRAVNERFCRYVSGTPMGYPFDVILTAAREKLERILGVAPPLDELMFRFGPGAQTNVEKKHACSRVKLGVQLECSHELAPFAHKVLAELPLLAQHHAEYVCADDESVHCSVRLNIVPGQLLFVNKDAITYRTINKEPGLNVLFQQGIGKSVRKRLRKAGIDLDDQGRNRTLAYRGSLNNQLATIDFSSASDTIATQMVAFLIPESWFVLMSLARTREVTYKGITIRLEKFSTMGNSYTFELESAIFYALAFACCRFLHLPTKDLSIYGDDLIVPSQAFHLVEYVFAFAGFTVNSAKSYWDGPFRESCGADYFLGLDIRPYYQKDLVSPETLFVLHNHYMRTGECELARELVSDYIHPDLAVYGPDGYGDGHLIGAWESVQRRVKLDYWDSEGKKTSRKFPYTSLGWEGSYFRSYRHSKAQNSVPHNGDCLLPTYSTYVRGQGSLLGEATESLGPFTKGSWADDRHFTVPGSSGYEVTYIYTLTSSVFSRR